MPWRRRPLQTVNTSSPRRRVLIIVPNLPVPLDRRPWMQSLALRDAGYGVSVVCPRGAGDAAFEELEGIRIHRYRPAPPARGTLGFLVEFAYGWLAAARLALRVLRREGFDALQACNPPDTYWALAWPLELLGRRFVYDQHDLCPEVYRSRTPVPRRALLAGLGLLERLSYRAADHVISVNESYRAIALGRGRQPGGKVTVVRSAPDRARRRPRAAEPALRRGRPFLACYLGVMGPQDGVDLALRAVHHLVHELGRDDCHVALLGAGDCYDDLRRLATDLGVGDHVTFTGWAGDELICRYLSTADVALAPDPSNPLNDVSTMNKTLEYLSFGLPVVAFDLPETRRTTGAAAVYVEPNRADAFAKALADLLDAPGERAAMAGAGRAAIAGWLSWERQAATYVGIYDRLLGGPGGA